MRRVTVTIDFPVQTEEGIKEVLDKLRSVLPMFSRMDAHDSVTGEDVPTPKMD